jgi:L-ornithine N5-oxygenase
MESEPLGSRHFDLVCVGFGATSLALAVALEERRPKDQRVLFLESQSRATWRPCTDNGVSSRLRTPFLDDLVTSENPRSRFTFLNYLRVTGRLVFYANDSQICPAREMFADYLRWCASFFDDKVQYGQRVTAVVPSTSDKKVEGWKVAYVDSNGQKGFVTAKQVVCAVGNVPKTPAPLASPQFQSQVVHSSDCQEAIASLLKARSGSCRLAIVGDGQAAAEVFDHLHGIRGDHHVTWFTRDSVLRGGDQTPL